MTDDDVKLVAVLLLDVVTVVVTDIGVETVDEALVEECNELDTEVEVGECEVEVEIASAEELDIYKVGRVEDDNGELEVPPAVILAELPTELTPV